MHTLDTRCDSLDLIVVDEDVSRPPEETECHRSFPPLSQSPSRGFIPAFLFSSVHAPPWGTTDRFGPLDTRLSIKTSIILETVMVGCGTETHKRQCVLRNEGLYRRRRERRSPVLCVYTPRKDIQFQWRFSRNQKKEVLPRDKKWKVGSSKFLPPPFLWVLNLQIALDPLLSFGMYLQKESRRIGESFHPL